MKLWIIISLCLAVLLAPIPFSRRDEAQAQFPQLIGAGAGGPVITMVLEGLGVITLPAWFVPVGLTTIGVAAVTGVAYVSCPGRTRQDKAANLRAFFSKVGAATRTFGQTTRKQTVEAHKLATILLQDPSIVLACPTRTPPEWVFVNTSVAALTPTVLHKEGNAEPEEENAAAGSEAGDASAEYLPDGSLRIRREGRPEVIVPADQVRNVDLNQGVPLSDGSVIDPETIRSAIGGKMIQDIRRFLRHGW